MGGATIPYVPMPCNIIGWALESDASGSIVVDVLRINKSGPPSASIVGSGNMPTLSSAQWNSAVPSGWTSVALAVGDCIGFKVISATTVQRVTLALTVAY